MEPSLREFVSFDWITVLLVISLLLITLARQLYPKRFEEFVLLPLTDKYFLVQGRADHIQHPFNILLFVNQVIAVSLFLMIFISNYRPELIEFNWQTFAQVSAIYGAFVLAKVCVEKIVAITFKLESLLDKYLYEKLTYRNLFGILLWVLNLIVYYTWDPTYWFLLGSVFTVLILNAITLFYSFKSNEKVIFRHFFYFILYLCALEISPYVILYKVFVA